MNKYKLTWIAIALIAILLATACSRSPDSEEATDVPVVAQQATEEATEIPIEEATEIPTEEPTEVPTEEPTEVPTEVPTVEPTEVPPPAWEAPNGALVSAPVTEAPVLDGVADDAMWADVTAISVEVEDGANSGAGMVDVKSVL